MLAATNALSWLCEQSPTATCGPVQIAPPAVIYCTNDVTTLLMTGLWVPCTNEITPFVARTAKVLHLLWRRATHHRSIWTSHLPPHRLLRWESERVRASATWAIHGGPPSRPTTDDECAVCCEEFSASLPTPDLTSASAHMYACSGMFPGHVMCRGCESRQQSFNLIRGQPDKCPLCRADRYQLLMG